MSTITKRKNAKGVVTGYKAQVRIRRKGVIVHQETKTFDREAPAKEWAKGREVELAKPGILEAIRNPKIDPTLKAAITKYLTEIPEVGQPKRKALNVVAQSDLGKLACSCVTAQAIAAYGKSLRVNLARVTVSGYLSHLKSVFKVAKTDWGYPLEMGSFKEALDTLSEYKATGTSDRRDRRPNLGEISRIIERQYARWLANPKMCPHHLITLFAIFSARRQGEILRMRWSDLRPTDCRLMVFNMKDPKKKIGNNVLVDVTYEALRVLTATRRGDTDLIFPYAGNTISTTFKEDCEALEIEDLRFHDLRHEGTSRLFELGFDIPRVAAMTGHKTWIHLQRYSHIHEYGDKYAGWRWLELIAPLPQRPA
jgi:integrase